jgi:hypothetical protein
MYELVVYLNFFFICKQLERYGYSSVPTDCPTRVTEVPDKWIWPTRRPADLHVDPEDPLITTPVTPSRLGVQDKIQDAAQ